MIREKTLRRLSLQHMLRAAVESKKLAQNHPDASLQELKFHEDGQRICLAILKSMGERRVS